MNISLVVLSIYSYKHLFNHPIAHLLEIMGYSGISHYNPENNTIRKKIENIL